MALPVQYGTPVQGADAISQLQADRTQPTQNELYLVDNLFQQNKSTMNLLAQESKDLVLIAVLFILFSLPSVVTMMGKMISIMNGSEYISIFIRALCVVILFWLIKYFYLSRS